MTTWPRPSRRTAMSLVELLIALTIASVIVVAMSAPVFLAIEATRPSTTPDIDALTSAQALTEIADDLQFALTISEQAARACTVVVADRNSNLSNETIRYAWSGVAGEPLTKQTNAGAVVNIVDNVHDAEFFYYTVGGRAVYVRICLQVGANSRAGMETVARTWNEP